MPPLIILHLLDRNKVSPLNSELQDDSSASLPTQLTPEALVSTSNYWSLDAPDLYMGSEIQILILILAGHVLCPSAQLLGLFTIFSFRDFSYVWYYSVTFIAKFLHSLISLLLEVLEVFRAPFSSSIVFYGVISHLLSETILSFVTKDLDKMSPQLCFFKMVLFRTRASSCDKASSNIFLCALFLW